MTPNEDKLTNQVRERISTLSDEELLRMLQGKRHDYTSFAWKLAQQELLQRGGEEAVQRRIAEEMAEEVLVEEAPTYTGEGLRCDVYKRDDYAGFWIRNAAGAIDGVILSTAFALLGILGENLPGILGLVLLATYTWGSKAPGGLPQAIEF